MLALLAWQLKSVLHTRPHACFCRYRSLPGSPCCRLVPAPTLFQAPARSALGTKLSNWKQGARDAKASQESTTRSAGTTRITGSIEMASQGSPAPLASELRVALGRLRYARAKHQSERAAWEVAGPSAGALFEAALTDLARERDDLHAAVDQHYEACRAELLASRDDADEDAGAAAALDAIDRQCRLVDQTAAAIQETLSGDVAAAAPRLLARADDCLLYTSPSPRDRG